MADTFVVVVVVVVVVRNSQSAQRYAGFSYYAFPMLIGCAGKLRSYGFLCSLKPINLKCMLFTFALHSFYCKDIFLEMTVI